MKNNSKIIINNLISKTGHSRSKFTGASVISTLINNKQIIKYKVSLYFGYDKKKNPISKTIEIDKQLFLLLPTLINEYVVELNQLQGNKDLLSIDDLNFEVIEDNKTNITSLQGSNDLVTPPTITNTINTLTTNTKEKEVFDKFRKSYPGTRKKGLDTEFNNFTKKHKDWKDVLPKLEKLNLTLSDFNADEDKKYVPAFTVFINNRQWEYWDGDRANKVINHTNAQNNIEQAKEREHQEYLKAKAS